ncbi:MAG: neutral/alkaline non-lysosomal ceramidase N-terminal domain-containing protein [Caldilineaceae bacterium]
MSTTLVPTPTSHLRFGVARADITPPVGMYHPMWGAARHHQATGIHRPLTGEAMAFAPLSGGKPLLRIQLDHIGLEAAQQQTLLERASQASGVDSGRIIITHSHSHAAGNTSPDRIHFPGGDMIEPYLQELYEKMAQTTGEAIANLQETVITYAHGRCNMAANRDYWDDTNGIFACGYNPDAPADDTVLVARMSDLSGKITAVLVNYACHPTNLAWENTLISPDYVGAMREVVEQATGATCVFALGMCGELGGVRGHQGSTTVADANGLQLGYAALSALASMNAAATDFAYAGPVVSGATLGTWKSQPFTEEHAARAQIFTGDTYTVHLQQKPRPTVEALEAEVEDWMTQQHEADQRGDVIAARNFGARAERARRWISRVTRLPAADTYPFHFTIHRFGDALWITTGGEPYNLLQTELRRRFPQFSIVVSPLAGDMPVAYLLPKELYGKGLYQEEPSILAAGCLERLIDAIAEQIELLI